MTIITISDYLTDRHHVQKTFSLYVYLNGPVVSQTNKQTLK